MTTFDWILLAIGVPWATLITAVWFYINFFTHRTAEFRLFTIIPYIMIFFVMYRVFG